MTKKSHSKLGLNQTISPIQFVDLLPSVLAFSTILFLIFDQFSKSNIFISSLAVIPTVASAILSVRRQRAANKLNAWRLVNWFWIWASALYLIAVVLVNVAAANTLNGYTF